MPRLLTFLILINLLGLLSVKTHAQYSNSFLLIIDRSQGITESILPWNVLLRNQDKIHLDTTRLNQENSNGGFMIIQNGKLIRHFVYVDLDKSDWSAIKDSVFVVQTPDHFRTNLPYAFALEYEKELQAKELYYQTNHDPNDPFIYHINVSGQFLEIPDTSGLSYHKKKQISDSLLTALEKKYDSLFPDYRSQTYFGCNLAFYPVFNINLTNPDFDLTRLNKLEFRFNRSPAIVLSHFYYTVYYR